MLIFLMRHGEALSGAEWSKSDSLRPLSKRGKREIESAASSLSVTVNVKRILTSPFARTFQTAQTLAPFYPGVSIDQVPDLASGARAEPLRQVLLKFQKDAPLLVIGHMPDLAVFVARVIGDPFIIEEGIQPGEIMAVDTGAVAEKWGDGKILWRKKLNDWKN